MDTNDDEPFVSVDINAPASRVWEILADVPRWKDVISGIDDITFEDAEDTTLRPGLAWDETRVMFGRSETQRMEIAEVDAASFYVRSKNESCGASTEFVHRVVPSAGGEEDASTLELYFASTPLTWLAWSLQWMAALTRGMMRKVILQDLMDIKSEAEKPQA
eukprot:CAMPEP_0172564842 /NCGR_PEP_ID=MMETSP1067-20121228/105897_1 /TAXON_ID=265564 ORGANISM="Thalassiosira punctigera, Strain Tpunct2005C2" /NCGR_SAMPLE_ID=MMETSP1067 /ASSEMBLY_ACC=CAM_ASM_000444 /LENGTH=161 /DNA_ID=CAMNT_0013355615 /DNA_START=20 /DNA_END=502 /DNA_ORIENTATION=-